MGWNLNGNNTHVRKDTEKECDIQVCTCFSGPDGAVSEVCV